MQSVSFTPRAFGRVAAVCFALVAAGCQSTDTGGVLNLGRNQDNEKQKITEAELRAFCPAASLREGTAYYNNYAKGGQDDPSKLAYQASISDITRSCTYNGPTMTINVAVAGRVVPGPAAAGGSINLPIRIVVLQGEEVIYSQLHSYPVALAAGTGAAQFVFNDPNIVVPQTGQRNIQVFAGYDEGPPEKKRRASAD